MNVMIGCVQTWLSYGKNATLISLSVLIFLAAVDLHKSLNNSSGQTSDSIVFFVQSSIQLNRNRIFKEKRAKHKNKNGEK